MQRSSSSFKRAQKVFSRSLGTSSASRQPSAVPLPLGGATAFLPHLAGVFDAPHNLRESLDSGFSRTGLGSDFHSLPAPTLIDGPARRPHVQTLWPACHISLSQINPENQRAVEIFDGPSHYHRSHYGPPQRREKHMFTFVLAVAIVIGGGTFLNLH